MLVSPTRDRDTVKRAISTLQLAESTATGEAIQASLASIRSVATQIQGPEQPPPGRIILLSDGKQTIPSDLEAPRGAFTAADQAKQQDVPISAISFGTDYGEIEIEGRPVPVAVADSDMQEIARRSGGDFSKAASQQDLRADLRHAARADRLRVAGGRHRRRLAHGRHDPRRDRAGRRVRPGRSLP